MLQLKVIWVVGVGLAVDATVLHTKDHIIEAYKDIETAKTGLETLRTQHLVLPSENNEVIYLDPAP